MATARNMIYHKLLDHCTHAALNHCCDININSIKTEFSGDSIETFRLNVEFDVTQNLDGRYEDFMFTMCAYYIVDNDNVETKLDVYAFPDSLSDIKELPPSVIH
ncbi:hypothetical protein ACWLO4_002581 [Vibrio vulnificus]